MELNQRVLFYQTPSELATNMRHPVRKFIVIYRYKTILDLLPVIQYAKYHPFEIQDQLLGRGCRHHFQGCNQNRPLLVLCFHAAHTYCLRVQV